MEQDIKKEFDRLHKEIKALAAVQGKATWVGPGWILDVTGWTKRKLQDAREQKIVDYRPSKGGGYEYKLESIPEIFIKQIQTQ